MSDMNVLSAVQTRSGLMAIKKHWFQVIEQSPWADFEYIQSSLWDEEALVFPIFAIKYEWNGSGNKKGYIPRNNTYL